MADKGADRFREEVREVASVAQGAARDEKDMRNDRITAKLLDMVDRLQRDVMNHMRLEENVVRELRSDMARIEAKVDAFVQAFPEGDAIQHRLAHESQMKEAEKKERFFEKMKFTFWSIILAGLTVWLSIVVWKAFLIGPK